MTEQINQIPAGCVQMGEALYMRDAKERLVPLAQVSQVDQLEDQTVRKILDYAAELNAQISRFKGHCFDDVGAFMALIAEKYGASKGGAKGNITLTSFDGCAKVQIQVSDNLTFGPELQVAKTLVDECIAEWAADARAEIRLLVEDAFRVDKEGLVSREAIFRLRRIEIDDERWRRAMDAITDSIRVVGSRTYMRFYQRPSPRDSWKAVTIDLASAEMPAVQAAE